MIEQSEESINELWGNIERNDICSWKKWNGTQRAWNIKENAKLDFMKILTIDSVKDTFTRMKDKSQIERKYF